MNDLHSPTQSRWSEDHVDGLLRGFFRAEMPDPWPALAAPEAAPKLAAPPLSSRKRWFRIGARVALAASVGFVLVAYLALARYFPRTNQAGPEIERVTPDIGKNPRRVTTPHGREALMWEQSIPGDRPTFIIELQEIKGPNGRSPR